MPLAFQAVSNQSDVGSFCSPGGTGGLLIRMRATVDLAQASGQLWLQLFDSASAPANNAVPVVSVPFDSLGQAVVDYGITGRQFVSNTWGMLSTTPLALTIAEHSGSPQEAVFDAQFI